MSEVTQKTRRSAATPDGYVGLTEAGRLAGVHRDRVRRAA